MVIVVFTFLFNRQWLIYSRAVDVSYNIPFISSFFMFAVMFFAMMVVVFFI
ncbi:hypothetical protein BMS3Abin08_00382 [bacterium BMS3Abin08]|nr:hypothetical protein BMS3Abin08_00382 [bacterium BMS3Abin08]